VTALESLASIAVLALPIAGVIGYWRLGVIEVRMQRAFEQRLEKMK
jgi:hypothetical protein